MERLSACIVLPSFQNLVYDHQMRTRTGTHMFFRQYCE